MDGRSCEEGSECDTDEVKWADGSCWFCPPYKKLENRQCVSVQCGRTHRISKKGECIACPINYVSTPFNCEKKYNCRADQIYND